MRAPKTQKRGQMTTSEPRPCRPMWEPQWPQKVPWLGDGDCSTTRAGMICTAAH